MYWFICYLCYVLMKSWYFSKIVLMNKEFRHFLSLPYILLCSCCFFKSNSTVKTGQWKSLSHQSMSIIPACRLQCVCLNCDKIQNKCCTYPQLFQWFSSRGEENSSYHGDQPLAINCSASRQKIEEHDSTDGNYTSAEGPWPHPSPHLSHLEGTGVMEIYLPWRTGFTGLVTAQRLRLNGRTLNIQLFTHAIVSHQLLPDFHTPVWMPCPDTSAHHKHGA